MFDALSSWNLTFKKIKKNRKGSGKNSSTNLTSKVVEKFLNNFTQPEGNQMTRSTLTRFFVLGSIVTLSLAVSATSSQAQSRAYLNNNNVPSTGVALEGYCPVAYFAVNKAIKGKPEHAVEHRGIYYYFVNAKAKAEFQKNPDKYVPAYGGWCALGMAIGDKFPVDPTNFKIVDGKLNLFLKNKNVDALAIWNKGNESEYVKKANAHWKKVNK